MTGNTRNVCYHNRWFHPPGIPSLLLAENLINCHGDKIFQGHAVHVDVVRRERTRGHHVSVYLELSDTNALDPDGLVRTKLHVRVRVRAKVRFRFRFRFRVQSSGSGSGSGLA